MKETIKQDWDFVIVVDGMEGGGKSKLALTCAYYVDPTFTLDRVAFNPAEFKHAIDTAVQYQAVVFDEAYLGLGGKYALTWINRSLISMLTKIRQKNLFVFIVLPSFFDLDKYVSLWRSRALIHIYTGDKMERGYFRFYNYERKLNLWVKGHKIYNYNLEKPNFFGRFTNFMPLDDVEYRKKKLKDLSDYRSGQYTDDVKRYAGEFLLKRLNEVKLKIPDTERAKLLQISRQLLEYHQDKMAKETEGQVLD
jgi:hypothetical protein